MLTPGGKKISPLTWFCNSCASNFILVTKNPKLVVLLKSARNLGLLWRTLKMVFPKDARKLHEHHWTNLREKSHKCRRERERATYQRPASLIKSHMPTLLSPSAHLSQATFHWEQHHGCWLWHLSTPARWRYRTYLLKLFKRSGMNTTNVSSTAKRCHLHCHPEVIGVSTLEYSVFWGVREVLDGSVHGGSPVWRCLGLFLPIANVGRAKEIASLLQRRNNLQSPGNDRRVIPQLTSGAIQMEVLSTAAQELHAVPVLRSLVPGQSLYLLHSSGYATLFSKRCGSFLIWDGLSHSILIHGYR